jgi:hypothetical protein
MKITPLPVARCGFVDVVEHASYYGPKAKLSRCRCLAEKEVEVENGTILRLCTRHAGQVAQRQFVRLGA